MRPRHHSKFLKLELAKNFASAGAGNWCWPGAAIGL